MKNFNYYFFSTIIAASISFFSLPLFTRLLTPKDYGIVALFILFGTTLTRLLSLGLHDATLRFYYEKNVNKDFFLSLNFTNYCFLIIFYTLFGFIINFYSREISIFLFKGELGQKLIFLSYIYGCFFSLYHYLTNLLIAQQRAKEYFFISSFYYLVSFLLSFLFISFFSKDATGRINGIFLTLVIFLPIIFFMQFKYFKPVFFFSHLKKSIKYSLPLLPDDLLGLFQNSIDKFMLQIYKSINYVGLYDISLKVADISKFFFDAASKVWNPFFLKESEKTDGKSKKKLVLRYNIYLFFMNSLTFIVCIFSDELIKILLDKNFHSVNIYVPICCLSVLIAHSFSTVALPQLQYAKKLTIIPVSSFFTMIINLTLNFLLIPKYGVFGAVLATVFSNTFWSIFIFYNSQKNYYLPFNHLFLYGNIIFFLIFLIPVYFLLIIKIFWFYKLIIKIIITLIYVILINKFFKLKIFKYLKIYKSKLI